MGERPGQVLDVAVGLVVEEEDGPPALAEPAESSDFGGELVLEDPEVRRDVDVPARRRVGQEPIPGEPRRGGRAPSRTGAPCA